MTTQLNRRRFLALSGGTASLALLAACAQPAAPAATTAAQPTATKPPAQVPQVPQTQATAAGTTAATKAATQAPAAATKGSEPKRGGTFTLGVTAGVQEFNPMALIVGHAPFIRSVYNTPVRYDDKLNPVPELAEKWDFSADGKTMTLKLREGVKFHTGREFTADDVEASLKFGQTNDRAIMKAQYSTVKSVEKNGKYTIALKFDVVNPGVFDMLDSLYIIDKDTIEDRAKTGIGTGPFKIDKYIPNDRTEMLPNKDYWDKGKPYLDKYIFRQIPDAASLTVNLESGSIDATYNGSYSDAARLRDSGGGKWITDTGAPGASVFDVGINVKADPFTNKKVRQAIAWSIDRARFCKSSLQGLSHPTCLIWPEHSWGHQKDLEGKIGYDLEKARALLKEAGLEKGFTTEIKTSSKTTQGYTDLSIILQADLKKLGIEAKVTDLEPAQYDAQTQKGDITIIGHAYGRAGRDPGTTLTGAKSWYLEKEGGWCHYEGAEYEQMRKDMQSTLDRPKREQLARKIQELMLDECFTNPVAGVPRMWVYGNYVKGLTYNMDNYIFAGEVWLAK
ncbi:MAG: ABC transporter substrate-binding protein [Chloroflexota bacterium]